MGIALLTTIGSLIYAAYEYSQKPKEPAPAQTAPAEVVNIDDFLKKIQQVKKVEAPPVEDSAEPTAEQPKQEKPVEKKYLSDARQLLACAKEFEVKTETNYQTDKLPVVMEYLDDIDITEFTDIPTYKRMCICIMKNDHLCKFMGFSLTKEETEMKNNSLNKYKNISPTLVS